MSESVRRAPGAQIHDQGSRVELHGESVRLHPDASAVWAAIDDEREPRAVVALACAVRPGLAVADAWAILDELAEAGLLQARVAPPAARPHRRTVFRAAVGVAAAVALAPLTGRAQDAGARAEPEGEALRAKSEKKVKAGAKAPVEGEAAEGAAAKGAKREKNKKRKQQRDQAERLMQERKQKRQKVQP